MTKRLKIFLIILATLILLPILLFVIALAWYDISDVYIKEYPQVLGVYEINTAPDSLKVYDSDKDLDVVEVSKSDCILYSSLDDEDILLYFTVDFINDDNFTIGKSVVKANEFSTDEDGKRCIMLIYNSDKGVIYTTNKYSETVPFKNRQVNIKDLDWFMIYGFGAEKYKFKYVEKSLFK